jgi:hypothetical protein
VAQKKYINHVLEACQALNLIISRYPKIKIPDIELFTPVYYPIALIEMDFDEQSFENFETIQLAVLQFVNSGILDPNVISSSMGIGNPNYIYNVLQLLKGYGHINNVGITDLGKQSLSEEKKITLSRVKQQFQLDALNGTLIEIDQNLISSSIKSSNETEGFIGHLNYIDGIQEEYIEKQLRSRGFDHFKKYKSTILNSNVLQIHNMYCIGMQYAKCYLLKLQSVNMPIIIGKRFNSKGATDEDRFFWEPLSIPPQASRFFLDCHPLNNNSPAADQYIRQLQNLINESAKSIDPLDNVTKTLREWNSGLTIREQSLQIYTNSSLRLANICVEHTDFNKFNGALLGLLDVLTYSEEYLLTSPKLYGRLVSITTTNKYILYTVSAYRELKKREDSSSIAKEIRTHIAENGLENLQGEELFKAIFDFCKQKIHS